MYMQPARQSKHEEAEAMQRRALEGRKKVPGLKHPDTLANVHNLRSIVQYAVVQGFTSLVKNTFSETKPRESWCHKTK
jgi:hypothetical protein